MLRKIVLLSCLLLGACEYCTDEAHEVLGHGAVCAHGAENTVVCLMRDGSRYVCFTDGKEHGIAVCIEGVRAASKLEDPGSP